MATYASRDEVYHGVFIICNIHILLYLSKYLTLEKEYHLYILFTLIFSCE
jgi:hypothetical protein